MKKFVLIALISFVAQGCAKMSGHEKSSLTGSGFRAYGLASAGRPTIASAAAAAKKGAVKKVRIQKEDDGKTYAEYLDPVASTETWIKIGEVSELPKGTQLHHWGPKADVENWTKNGISEQDIAESRDHTDNSDVMGGGFYLSKDPVDSSSYGSNCLIAELEEPINIINLRSGGGRSLSYDSTTNTYTVNSAATHASIATHLVAEAGIDAILYRSAWMVAITGKPVKHLFEASWANFSKVYNDDGDGAYKAIEFSKKYELTEAVAKSSDFKKSFSSLAGYLTDGKISDESLNKIASALVDSEEPVIPDFESANKFSQLLELVKTHEKSILAERLSSPGLEHMKKTDLLSKVMMLQLSLSEVSNRYRSLLPPMKFLTPASTQGYIVQSTEAGVARKAIKDSMGVFGLYEELAAAPTAPLLGDVSAKLALIPNYEEQKDLLKLAQLWDPKAVYRDLPSSATGPFKIDGDQSEGYLEISEDGKDDLLKDPFIVPTVRSTTDGKGLVKWFIRYEQPSVVNYKKFLSKLPLDLQNDLNVADLAGKLIDPTSADARALTLRIVQSVASQLSTGLGDPGAISRVAPFADKKTMRFVLMGLEKVSMGKVLLLPTQDLLMTTSSLELLETQFNAFSGDYLFDSYLKDAAQPRALVAFDLDHDLGVWKVAAQQFDPKDAAAFIAAVKKRFQDPDVQEWVKSEDDLKVLNALHEAGANL